MSASHSTNAVFLTSTVIVFALEGFLAVQTAHYYSNFPQDPLITKIWVLLVNLVQFVHNSICGYISWRTLIAAFNPNSHAAPASQTIFAMLSTLESFAGFFTTAWFGLRLWYLLGRRWRWIAVPALASSCFVLGIGLVLAEQDGKPVSKQIHSYVASGQRNLHTPWIAGNILADLLIAVPMVLKLRAARSGFQKTDSILNSLSTYIVGTSLLTSSFATAGLVTLVALPGTSVWVAPIRIMSSIYSNTLLTFLNRRAAWNENSADNTSGNYWKTTEASDRVERKGVHVFSRSNKRADRAPSNHVDGFRTAGNKQANTVNAPPRLGSSGSDVNSDDQNFSSTRLPHSQSTSSTLVIDPGTRTLDSGTASGRGVTDHTTPRTKTHGYDAEDNEGFHAV